MKHVKIIMDVLLMYQSENFFALTESELWQFLPEQSGAGRSGLNNKKAKLNWDI